MYTTEELLSVLLSIKYGASDSDYLFQQLGYDKLGTICAEASDKGYIIDKNRNFILTKKGVNYLEVLCKELDRKGVDKEISKLTSVIISKISINDIYLP